MLTQPSGPPHYAGLQFADAASCEDWLETLPLQRTVEAHEMVSAQAGLVIEAPLPPLEKLGILEVLYRTACYLQETLAGRYIGCALPLSIVEYSMWRTVVELWQTLLDAYEHCLQAAVAGGAGVKGHALLAALRAIELQAAVIHEHHRVYREVPATLWQRLHSLYACAERHGLAAQGHGDPLAIAGQRRTPTAAYVAILLNHLSNPYTMSPRQMKLMYRWARLWEGSMVVGPRPPAPGTSVALAVDLCSGEPALPSRRIEAGSSVRYLDLDPLAQALRRLLALLRQGHAPAALGLGEDCRQPGCERLLTLLYIQWCGSGMGAFSEQREHGEDARAWVGLRQVLQQLHRASPARGGIKALVAPSFPGSELWYLLGTSAPGFVAVARGPECEERVQHHQLIALGRRGSSPLQLGVVQWMRLEESRELSLGLRLLPGVPSPTAMRSVEPAGDTADAGNAIVLPAAPELRTPATLLAAPGFFTAGRMLDLLAGTPTRVRLLRLLERGVDFERAVFETTG